MVLKGASKTKKIVFVSPVAKQKRMYLLYLHHIVMSAVRLCVIERKNKRVLPFKVPKSIKRHQISEAFATTVSIRYANAKKGTKV